MSHVLHYGGHSYAIEGGAGVVSRLIGAITAACSNVDSVEIPTATGNVTIFLGPGIPVAVEEVREQSPATPRWGQSEGGGGEEFNALTTRF
ncbi:hypothetical protein [Prescottella equi]|uniref:hypothetical protein n=1 Tax=Rhodococcus hoagii TaxID=43767 RepID=UPI00111C57E5|nr:hypothetical protein [Prescottella equi]